MSEKTAIPKVEDIMSGALNGNTLKNALEFIAYLRDNKINPQWSATNVWKISYKTYSVCFIRVYGAAEYHNLETDSWHIVPFIGEYEESSMSDEFKKIVWANKRTCPGCGLCALQLNTVFGKEYDYACEKAIIFTNPDATDIECVIKLIELRRSAIKEGKAKKHKYMPVKDRQTKQIALLGG